MNNLDLLKINRNPPDDPDMGLWSYAYDALPLQGASRSNLTRQTDARDQRICLYYDPFNRLSGKHYRADDNCPASPPFNVSTWIE